jgi:hypothetical protein
VCLDAGSDVFVAEFVDDIELIQLGSTGGFGTLLEVLQFGVLADVDADGDDIVIVVFLQPRDDDGGIETAGISEDDLFFPGVCCFNCFDCFSGAAGLTVPAFTFATGFADAFFAAAMIFSPFSSLYEIALFYDVSVPFIRTALNIHQRLCNCKCKFIHF